MKYKKLNEYSYLERKTILKPIFSILCVQISTEPHVIQQIPIILFLTRSEQYYISLDI